MKPRSGDIKFSFHVQGKELELFKDICMVLPESFGLDSRIEKYQGKRPIAFWLWDLDYLESVFEEERMKRPATDKVFASLEAKFLALYKHANEVYSKLR
jgi:hypothetical protein